MDFRVTDVPSTTHVLENWAIEFFGISQYFMICPPAVATHPHG